MLMAEIAAGRDIGEDGLLVRQFLCSGDQGG